MKDYNLTFTEALKVMADTGGGCMVETLRMGVVIMLSKDGGSIVAKDFKRRGDNPCNLTVTVNLMRQEFRRVFTQPDAMVK